MLRHLLVAFSVLGFAILIAYRAYAIPFTHDEASTWINYRYLNVWTCTTNTFCWGSANNHWLNTLLLQVSASLFGESPFAIRLPNVLAGVAYLVCAALISARFIKNYSMQLAAFMLLCGHVYLLDFFSLARGYGLMACGVIWSIYFLLRYLKLYEARWIILCILALFFSVLANFTTLLALSATGFCWLIWLLLKKQFPLILKHGLYWLACAAVLFLLLHIPLSMLQQAGEFEWGATSIPFTALNLVESLLYGVRYFGDKSFLYEALIIIVFILIGIVAALLNTDLNKKQHVLFVMLLLLSNIFIMFLQTTLTGASPPVGRKSIYLIPVVFMCLVMALALLKDNGTTSFLGFIISLAFIGHIIFTIHLKACREWYYDAYYPELLSEIIPEGSASDSIGLGTTWIFNPALVFYQRTIPLPLKELKYQRPLVIDTTNQYYYVIAEDSIGLASRGFELKKMVGHFFLFENKNKQ